jgi:hypothetical protein
VPAAWALEVHPAAALEEARRRSRAGRRWATTTATIRGLLLGLALDPTYVEGFVEGCLERIREDDPEEEGLLRGNREEGDDLRGFVPEALKGGVEVRAGRP